MDVSGIKTAQLITPGVLTGDVDETEKSKIVNQSEGVSHSEKIIEELGERYNLENAKKAKPRLNGNQTGKQRDDKAPVKKMSINELFAQLSDDLLGEKIKNSGVNANINNNILKNIWSPQKESDLEKNIISYFNALSVKINNIADYYFSIVNDQDDDYNNVRMFFSEGKNVNFSDKNAFLACFNNNATATISGKAGNCCCITNLIKKLLDDIISLPKVKDQMPIIGPQEMVLLKSEINILHSAAETLSSVRECLSAAQSLVNMNNKNTTEYNNSLTVLMGKLADLRDKMAQQKLENDRELARLQQLALQKKTDADAAEITEKVNKAKRLQALFKWLGPLLIAIMAVLTALTGGLLAKALAAVIVVMTIISEIVKATGGPDIMAKIMEPVMKLVEAIQKFIKDIAMAIGKFMGKSPEELKKLEKIMDIAAMVLAIVAVALLFVALSSVIGSIAGKFVGHFASKATEAAINSFFAQIKTLLINVMLTSTIINSASSVTNAVLQAQVTRLRADIELDSELLSRITELMNLIMETYTESQKELMALNEKISKCGNESFQRMKSIIQQGQLAV
jgi:hypothetical protein